MLAGYFLDQARQKFGIGRIDLHPQSLNLLISYDWPGNVRELEHLLLRAGLKAMQRDAGRVIVRPEALGLRDMPPESSELTDKPSIALPSATLREAVEAYERQIIAGTLNEHGGNWSQAAKRLGLDRANLQRLAKRLGIFNPLK